MTKPVNVKTDRINERLKALGLTERAASLQATGQADALRFIRTRGTVPSVSRLFKIASTLKATPAYLMGETDENEWEKDEQVLRVAANFNDQAISDRSNRSRTIPVIGSKSITDTVDDMGDVSIDLTITAMMKDIIGFVAPPAGLDGRGLIATYVNDLAMYPVFEPAVPIIMDLNREPGPGDYAVVMIGGIVEDRELKGTSFFLRRFVDRADDWITFEQFAPAFKFSVPAKHVSSMMRVLTLRDYIMPSEDKIPHTA